MSAGKLRWASGYSGGGSAGNEARWAGTGERGRDKTAASRPCVGGVRCERYQRLTPLQSASHPAMPAGCERKKTSQISSLRASTALGPIGAAP